MSIINFFNKIRKQLLVSYLGRIELPPFKSDDKVRKKVIFIGRVQGVGFRYEAYHIAQRLGLVGWVRNKNNGDVELEVEGPNNKVGYFIDYMSTIKRAPVSDRRISDLKLLEVENDFEIVG